MPTKKKKKSTKARKNPANPAAGAKRKKRPKKQNPAPPGVPRGMVLVPASMVGPVATAAKKKRKSGSSRRTPQKSNPLIPEGESGVVANGLAAIGFGTVAAVSGLLGGYALSKVNMKSKAGNVAVNVAAATVGGGLLGGFVDRTAGTVVAHNYMVAAGQWLAAPSGPSGSRPPTLAARARAGMAGGASPRVMANARRAVRSMSGAAEMAGIAADTFGDPDDDMGGMEPLDGIAADTFGDPDDHMGGMEPLDGIAADTFGDPDDDMGEFDELGDMADPFDMGDPDDDMGDTDDPFGHLT